MSYLFMLFWQAFLSYIINVSMFRFVSYFCNALIVASESEAQIVFRIGHPAKY